MHFIIFSIQNQQFGFVLSAIDRVILCVETIPLPHAPEEVVGVINVNGIIVPVVNMRKLLGLPLREIEILDQFILCTVRSKSFALLIDRVIKIEAYPDEELILGKETLPENLEVDYVLKDQEQVILVYNIENLLCHTTRKIEQMNTQ